MQLRIWGNFIDKVTARVHMESNPMNIYNNISQRRVLETEQHVNLRRDVFTLWTATGSQMDQKKKNIQLPILQYFENILYLIDII